MVHIEGRFESSQQWGDALIIESIAPAVEGSYDASALLETSPVPIERMEADLAALLDTIQNPDLRRLLDRFFSPESDGWERFRDAPAAKHYHQAYRHGLLEHTLSVAQGVSAAASFFPGIDRDVAITGALLHDIGKLEAYNDNPLAIDLTDLGRLIGEIPLGYYRVRSEIESIDGFDPDLGWAVLHIILSHHGTLEHGSPVTPATREATLVHMMDNLGGKLGSFDRIERTLAEGQAWSGFDRGIDGSAYFRDRGRLSALQPGFIVTRGGGRGGGAALRLRTSFGIEAGLRLGRRTWRSEAWCFLLLRFRPTGGKQRSTRDWCPAYSGHA